jgi:hypothetical protein
MGKAMQSHVVFEMSIQQLIEYTQTLKNWFFCPKTYLQVCTKFKLFTQTSLQHDCNYWRFR